MDGGRIFRALLSLVMNRSKATRIAATVGQFIAVLFIFMGFFFNPFLIFIGVFVYLGAQMEAEYTQTQSVLANLRVKDVMMTRAPVLREHEPLSLAVELLLQGQDKAFLVLNGEESVVGVVTQNDIIHGLSEKGKNVPVNEMMQVNFEVLDPDMLVNGVYSMMRQKSYSLLPVVLHGRLIGALDQDNIVEFVIIRNALQKYNENHPFERKAA